MTYILHYRGEKCQLLARVPKGQCPNGHSQAMQSRSYNSSLRKRNELVMTDTELKLIAAAARIGLSSSPKKG